jgi:Fe-S cluster assembly protein SufD
MAVSIDHYVAEYENARRTRSIEQPAWLVRARSDALNRFRGLGFPTTRDEEWRFTSVAPIADRAFTLGTAPVDAGRADVARYRLPGSLSAEMVFVNGHYVPSLSTFVALPQGTAAESLGSALPARAGDIESYLTGLASFEQQAFTALNTAFLADGAYIRIPDRTLVEKPIHVLFVSTRHTDGRPTMSHPRVLAVLGDGSEASIVESYAGPDGAAYFTNAVTEIVLGENAVLDHYKLQHESPQACHIGAVHVRSERNANCTSHSISLGGSLVRNDVYAVLDGEGAECTLNGLYLADEQRLVDNHTTIDHAKAHCGSREIYKGVLADRARGVFNGKIIVRPDAQKTDAKQTNRALLLSEDAQINTKPQLEIFANDVKCTHGAAVGQLDDEAVFYLRSRGLGESEARRLLIHAFAADVLNRMPLEFIRAGVEQVLQQRLAHALTPAA